MNNNEVGWVGGGERVIDGERRCYHITLLLRLVTNKGVYQSSHPILSSVLAVIAIAARRKD